MDCSLDLRLIDEESNQKKLCYYVEAQGLARLSGCPFWEAC